jgi:hypothetical protein
MDAQTEYLTDLAAALQEAADRLNALLMAQRRGAEDAGWEANRLELDADTSSPNELIECGSLDPICECRGNREPTYLPSNCRICGRQVGALGVIVRFCADCWFNAEPVAPATMVADAVAAAPPDVEPERGKSEDARYVTAGVPCPSEDAPEPECPQCADLEPKCARLEQSRRDLRKRNTDLRAANAATEKANVTVAAFIAVFA